MGRGAEDREGAGDVREGRGAGPEDPSMEGQSFRHMARWQLVDLGRRGEGPLTVAVEQESVEAIDEPADRCSVAGQLLGLAVLVVLLALVRCGAVGSWPMVGGHCAGGVGVVAGMQHSWGRWWWWGGD